MTQAAVHNAPDRRPIPGHGSLSRANLAKLLEMWKGPLVSQGTGVTGSGSIQVPSWSYRCIVGFHAGWTNPDPSKTLTIEPCPGQFRARPSCGCTCHQWSPGYVFSARGAVAIDQKLESYGISKTTRTQFLQMATAIVEQYGHLGWAVPNEPEITATVFSWNLGARVPMADAITNYHVMSFNTRTGISSGFDDIEAAEKDGRRQLAGPDMIGHKIVLYEPVEVLEAPLPEAIITKITRPLLTEAAPSVEDKS